MDLMIGKNILAQQCPYSSMDLLHIFFLSCQRFDCGSSLAMLLSVEQQDVQALFCGRAAGIFFIYR